MECIASDPPVWNDFSDCEYLNQYDFLSEVRAANLLPTFERSVFVLPAYFFSRGITCANGASAQPIAFRVESKDSSLSCTKSEHNYYVLNERILPKSTCEKIFGVNINEMNAEWERSRYNDGLRDIIRGSDTAEIYKYLIEL